MVKVKKQEKRDSTDINLLVSSASQETLEDFSKEKIIDSLEEEMGLDRRLGGKVAKQVEKFVQDSEAKVVTSSLVREIVDNVLLEFGYNKEIKKQALIGIPTYDLNELIFSKPNENSNISVNNPEAVNFVIAETVLKQYSLQHIFSRDVAKAHLTGAIHIHDLGFPTRLYCGSHSLVWLAKYGLELENLFTASVPAKHASTLTGHLNTFLSVMQAYWAGALGLGFMNVFYAPYLKGMPYEDIKQQVQYLWYSGAQNAFSRGAQSLFLDYGLTFNIPDYFMDTDAIGPSGKVVGKYKDFVEEAQLFTKAVIEVITKGDKYGRPFAFPKANINITEEAFTDKNQRELFDMACYAASENGTPYFVMTHDSVTLSQCCRLRFHIPDKSIFKTPEKIRFNGFQNVTINLPQAAYRGKGNVEKTMGEIEWAMDLAMKAHLQKKSFITRLMKDKGNPLWQIGKIGPDKEPYVNLETSSYIIGILGLNECVKFLTKKELHENTDVYKLGLKIISAMYLKAKKLGKEHKLTVVLEESPAESASYRLAKVDLYQYPESKDYMCGNVEKGDNVYYTNSIHYKASAPVGLLDRIIGQSKFHPMIEAGAITHAFVGEHKPDPGSIANLVEKVWRNTPTAQLTISPTFGFCEDCKGIWRE